MFILYYIVVLNAVENEVQYLHERGLRRVYNKPKKKQWCNSYNNILYCRGIEYYHVYRNTDVHVVHFLRTYDEYECIYV